MGPREVQHDKTCSDSLAIDSSGYCECVNGDGEPYQVPLTCGFAHGVCFEHCAAGRPSPPPPPPPLLPRDAPQAPPPPPLTPPMPPFWIPRKVEQTTYRDRACIAENHGVLDGYIDGLQLHVLDDAGARRFLEEHMPSTVPTWDMLAGHGAHRADLYRYVKLYVDGGIYLDIKIVPMRPLTEIFQFDWTDKLTWYTAVTPSFHSPRTGVGWEAPRIFNGVLITPPRNPIIHECILQAIRRAPGIVSGEYDYMINIADITLIADIIYTAYPDTLRMGVIETVESRLYLLEERCDVAPDDWDGHVPSECREPYFRNARRGDWRNLCCNIYAPWVDRDRPVFHGRDINYPYRDCDPE